MDDYKKLLFIINPVSGRKKGLPYVTDIVRIFFEYGYLTTTMLTTDRGDATKFTIDYGKDFDLIVCLGGDGTLNEVCSGLGKAGIHVPVGYIPAGSSPESGLWSACSAPPFCCFYGCRSSGSRCGSSW